MNSSLTMDAFPDHVKLEELSTTDCPTMELLIELHDPADVGLMRSKDNPTSWRGPNSTAATGEANDQRRSS